MTGPRDSRALLGRSHPLADGRRVRLRLARGTDVPALRRLLLDVGDDSEVAVGRLVHFDPRRECVVCATALIDGRERVVGLGAIDIAEAPGHLTPRLLVSDEVLAPGVRELLKDALAGCAGWWSRARAA